MLDQWTSEPNLRLIMIALAVLCALMGFLRGVGRLILLALSLAAGALAALAWYRYMPALCISWWGQNPADFIKWGAIVTGVITMGFARRFLNALTSGDGPREMNGRARVRGGLLGFIPGVLLLWGAAVAIRWAGASGNLRQVEAAAKAMVPAPLENTDLFGRLSLSLGQGVLGDIMNRTDPMSSKEAGALASLLVLQVNQPVWERTWRHPKAGPIIMMPAFRRLRDDKDVEHAISFAHYSRLLALPELRTALGDQPLREAVLNLDMETVLRDVITGRLSSGPPRAQVVPEL
jgi:hypothetical protein